MKKEEIIKTVDTLSNNAMFNVSLTSKELFHSNFWAWLIRKYPNIFAPVFGIDDIEENKLKINREKYHFDLSIETNDKLIIIENKLKSLPNKSQLDRYSKISLPLNKKLILISYINPLFNASLSGLELFDTDIEWECLNYKELCQRIKKCYKSAKSSDFQNNDSVLIQEYISFLENLNELNSCVEFDDSDKIGDLWSIIKDSEIKEKLSEINFQKTFERLFTSMLTERVLYGFEFTDNIDEIRINCGRDLKMFSDMLFYFPGAWDEDESKRQDLIYLGISLWENCYRYYAGLHKKQCNINSPKQGRYDKENKDLGFKYIQKNYSWFFNLESENGILNGYSYPDEMYLYKKVVISNYTVAELTKKVQSDLGIIYAQIYDL